MLVLPAAAFKRTEKDNSFPYILLANTTDTGLNLISTARAKKNNLNVFAKNLVNNGIKFF